MIRKTSVEQMGGLTDYKRIKFLLWSLREGASVTLPISHRSHTRAGSSPTTAPSVPEQTLDVTLQPPVRLRRQKRQKRCLDAGSPAPFPQLLALVPPDAVPCFLGRRAFAWLAGTLFLTYALLVSGFNFTPGITRKEWGHLAWCPGSRSRAGTAHSASHTSAVCESGALVLASFTDASESTVNPCPQNCQKNLYSCPQTLRI